MTDEMAFMKNWDLITPYFFNFNPFRKDNSEENWFAKRCINYQLLRDFETQLYIQYILGQKIASYLTEPERILRKKNVIVLMRKILNGLAFNKKNAAITEQQTEQRTFEAEQRVDLEHAKPTTFVPNY